MDSGNIRRAVVECFELHPPFARAGLLHPVCVRERCSRVGEGCVKSYGVQYGVQWKKIALKEIRGIGTSKWD